MCSIAISCSRIQYAPFPTSSVSSQSDPPSLCLRLGGQPKLRCVCVYSPIIGKLHCQSSAFFTAFPSEFSSIVAKLTPRRYSSVQKDGRARARLETDKSCLNINRSKIVSVMHLSMQCPPPSGLYGAKWGFDIP